MRLPWVSRLAYDTVCRERDRLLEENANWTAKAAQWLESFLSTAEQATGRQARSVEFEKVGTEAFTPTVRLKPDVTLSPEVEARISRYAEGEPSLKAELRAKALAMKESGLDDEEIGEHLLSHFRVEAF